MAENDRRRYSAEDLNAMKARGDYVPTRTDAPTYAVDEDFWRNARVVTPACKVHTGIRLDADMLAWFKAQGHGWQTRINAVLRSYYESQKPRSQRETERVE
jgi:uncharacterized protein (DUF4415 family)